MKATNGLRGLNRNSSFYLPKYFLLDNPIHVVINKSLKSINQFTEVWCQNGINNFRFREFKA